MPQPIASSLIKHLVAQPDLHSRILEKAIPNWLIGASTLHRETLKTTRAEAPDWYESATEAQHQTLKTRVAQSWTALNRLDGMLATLKTPAAFAQPLLQDALKRQFGLEQDVSTIHLRLYFPLETPLLPIRTGGFQVSTVSLIEAALHNFEASEALPDTYTGDSAFISQPSATGQFETVPDISEKLSIAEFVGLCRTLDIGAQYQRHIRQTLGFEDAARKTELRNQVTASLMAEAKVALQMASMKKDIDASAYYPLQGHLDGLQGMMLGGRPLLSHDLSLMSAQLTGIVLFAPDLELNRNAVPVVAYIPGDPDAPLKYYASSIGFMQALTTKLRSADYQKFFSRFVNHEDRGYFFADLNSRLSRVTWHQHVPGDGQPTWRDTPATKPDLQFSVNKITVELYEHLYQQKLDKIINDGQVMAVSTADTDRKARWERWDIVQKVAKTIMEIAAFIAAPFIPPLGVLMLGYTAYQLLDETVEGILDWAEGLKNQAFAHLMSILEQCVQLGLFAAGATIAEGVLREKLPTEIWSFFDRLHPVKNAAGNTRLWKPDLSPYAHDITLADDSLPDSQGLHRHNGKKILKIDAQHFALEQNNGRPALLHPSRQGAYRPSVMTNGKGAWVTELDRPLSWDSTTLTRRLGPVSETLSDARLEQARQISGTHDGALRKVHLNHESAPPLLADTLSRVNIDQKLQDFIAQMNSDDPQQYLQADPQLQLWMLTNKRLWPESKTLRFLNAKGQSVWEYPGTDQAAVVQIHEAQLNDGNLLGTLLETLDEPQRKAMLEEEFGYPSTSLETRTKKLRKKLAKLAQDDRTALFDTHYRQWTQSQAPGPRVQKIMDAASGLTISAAEEVLSGCNAQELLEIDQGHIPPRLSELARWAAHQVRVTRAYEGLYLDSVDSNDTHRLALHSLEKLPGWSSQMRLTVTDYSRTGTVRDAIGDPHAPIQRFLVRTASGEYVPETDTGTLFDATDFYTAILQALPDAQREALNLQIAQVDVLKQHLRQYALSRDALSPLLSDAPIRKPTYDPDLMRLPGGMGGYDASQPTPGPSNAPSLANRVHELYPSLRPDQITEVLTALHARGGAESTLISMKSEYLRLESDLSAWIADTPRAHLDTDLALTDSLIAGERQHRTLWARELKRCWRYETESDNHFAIPETNGNILRLVEPIYGELPRFNSRFEQISYLNMQGYPTTRGTIEFLKHFPKLRRLEIRDIPLRTLPSEVTAQATINELVLNNCAITLTAQSQTDLASMSRLKTLDLANNPLGRAPAVDTLPNLQNLNLSQTNITQLPHGLTDHPGLAKAILSDNQISELPAALFTLPDEATQGFDLSGNPLSRSALEQIKTYCQRTGEHLGAEANLEERRIVHELYPSYTEREANRFIFELPGTLDDSLGTLTRLKADYQRLQAQLEEWAVDVPEHHPTTGEPLDVQTRAQHQIIRRAFKDELQACWRRETPQEDTFAAPDKRYEFKSMLPVPGRLPELDVEFNHVSSLQLIGADTTSIAEGFINSFPELETLHIHRYTMEDIPAAVFNLPTLKALSLTKSSIRLTPETTDALSGLQNLEYLDLSDNPLGVSPDVSMMPNLSTLMLENAGLTEAPQGAFNRPLLTNLNLSDNLITELPSDILEVPVNTADDYDLNGNPFSPASIAMLRKYYQRTGEDFGVIEATLDTDMNPLPHTPASDTEEEMET